MMSATQSTMAARGMRSAAELSAGKPHGLRIRYMAGCRCQECRAANTSYEKARNIARKSGDWNGNVPAEKARAWLAALSKEGVGRRTVCDVTRVADSILAQIIAGRKKLIRARTERAILAVTAIAASDGAYVDAAPTWLLIDELLADGYTKTFLAQQLGRKTNALQLSRSQVTVRNAYEVQLLHARLRSCDATDTLVLLEDLSEEGFHRDRVKKLLADLAAKRGVDAPDLTVRRGRVREVAAQLVAQLHAELTE